MSLNVRRARTGVQRLDFVGRHVLSVDQFDRPGIDRVFAVADQMEPVPIKDVGRGNFVIGATKVRPRVPPSDGKPVSFKRNQKLNFWMQVYNLSVDEKTHKPSATIEYNVTDASNKAVIHATESTDTMGNVGEQVTLQKTLSAANLQPGQYKIEIRVNDKLSNQTVDPTATFVVE